MTITSLKFNRNQLIVLFSGGIILLLLLYALLRDSSSVASLDEVNRLIASNQIEKGVIDDKTLYLSTRNDGVVKIPVSQVAPELIAHVKIEAKTSRGWVWFLFLFGIIGGISWWVIKNRKKEMTATVEERGKSQEVETLSEEQLPIPVKSTVRFSDIGGINDVKEELEEIIDFLRNPKRYYHFGARLPRGVLLVGPPGVGKTMIAKAVAHEADVPFFYQSGASFVQIYVGMGAKRVHELFAAAKKNAPAIIFIDEIDAVGKKRGGERNEEREGTLNQLLTEMDGFEESSGIIVVAATNNIEVMDTALLRAGRFDRRIFVELPTANERAAILEKYLQSIPNNLSIPEIAKMTVGFSGASLAALVNEAALLCLRTHELHVTLNHFLAVKDKVMIGKKRLVMLTEKQRQYQVRYQAGKVFASTWFDLPYDKMTLIHEMTFPTLSEPWLKNEIEAQVRVALSGIAACQLRFGEHASNGAQDLAHAKTLAETMIYKYGMGESFSASSQEVDNLFNRLYQEIYYLLERHEKSLTKLEEILNEYEYISNALAKETIREIL
jgi:ATP-dependent metalloprotease FtsH